jgi:hypothetical protein
MTRLSKRNVPKKYECSEELMKKRGVPRNYCSEELMKKRSLSSRKEPTITREDHFALFCTQLNNDKVN